MDILIRNYLKKEVAKHERRQLRKTIAEYRKVQAEVGPMIKDAREAERARRSQGDGFVITDLQR